MNGVIAYLGSSFGKGPWINPAVTGNVRVMASSPPSRQTDYKALVSRNFVRVLSAGPRRQNDVSETWWALDLGPDARLACNCYTLRHDASEAFLRSWELQGSLEGDRWVTLRRHEADPTICIKGQFASFPVVSHASRTAYRYFRLFMLGPHASPWSEPPFQMHVGGWELYGYLIQSSAAPG